MRICKIVLATTAMLIALVMLSSCATPGVLMNRDFVGKADEKTRKYYVQKADGGTFNAYFRVCDIDNDGKETNCKDTLVLDNVHP